MYVGECKGVYLGVSGGVRGCKDVEVGVRACM